MYKLNPNYATIIKQNIDKLLVVGFIQYVGGSRGSHGGSH